MLRTIVAVVARRVLVWRRPCRPTRVSSAFYDPSHPGICRAAHGLCRTWYGPGPHDALHIGMQTVELHRAQRPVSQKPSRTAIVDTMQTTLQMDRQQADAFFERMIARKAYLFPDEIQPPGSVTLFMRKEVDISSRRLRRANCTSPTRSSRRIVMMLCFLMPCGS